MDIGMSELLVIGIVALIVIGPRDLPEMFRQLGRMTAKMRGMAREFNRAMEQAANETGVKDVAKDLKSMTSPASLGLNTVKGAMDKFEKWDPIKNAAKPTIPAKPALTPPPMPATPVPAAPILAGDAAATPVLAATPVAAEPAILPPVAPRGPATAALYDKKAAREAILAESAAKLRALDAVTVTTAPDVAAPDVAAPDVAAPDVAMQEKAPAKPARRKKAEPAPDAPAATPAAKAPRKKKAIEE